MKKRVGLKGRIVLPQEYLDRFGDGKVYFLYNPVRNSVDLIHSDRLRSATSSLESLEPYKRGAYCRALGSNLFLSILGANRRVMIPAEIAEKAHLSQGDEVNLDIENGVVRGRKVK